MGKKKGYRRKRYPGGKKLGMPNVPEGGPRGKAVHGRWLKSTENRIKDSQTGGRLGYRPVPHGNGVPVDNRFTMKAIGEMYLNDDAEEELSLQGEDRGVFEHKSNRKEEYSVFGTIYEIDEDGRHFLQDGEPVIVFQGNAEVAVGYAKEIMKILRSLMGDWKGPWTRRPFWINRRETGEYFFREYNYREGSANKRPGDVLVRPGQLGWKLEAYDHNAKPRTKLWQDERYQPLTFGNRKHKVGGEGTAHDRGMDVESRMQMSGAFEKFINNRS